MADTETTHRLVRLYTVPVDRAFSLAFIRVDSRLNSIVTARREAAKKREIRQKISGEPSHPLRLCGYCTCRGTEPTIGWFGARVRGHILCDLRITSPLRA